MSPPFPLCDVVFSFPTRTLCAMPSCAMSTHVCCIIGLFLCSSCFLFPYFFLLSLVIVCVDVSILYLIKLVLWSFLVPNCISIKLRVTTLKARCCVDSDIKFVCIGNFFLPFSPQTCQLPYVVSFSWYVGGGLALVHHLSFE